MCIQIQKTGGCDLKKFRFWWKALRTQKYLQKHGRKRKLFAENHPGNKNFSQKRKFSRKQNFCETKVHEISRKASEFSLIFAFRENEKVVGIEK
jgi:hypothetical protein